MDGKLKRHVRILVMLYKLMCSVTDADIDSMLSGSWRDPEDALLFQAALRIKADFVATRNADDFESDLVRAVDCEGFFRALLDEQGLEYDEVPLT